MSTADNTLLIRRNLEEVVSTRDVADLEKSIAPDYREVYDGKRYDLGIPGAKEHVLGVRRTYPDLIVRVDQQIGEGDWVATVSLPRHSSGCLARHGTGREGRHVQRCKYGQSR
jgi:hypothetical protein